MEGIFVSLNKKINRIMTEIITNDNLAKLLYYNDTTKPLAQPSLVNPDLLIETHVFPYAYVPDVVDSSTTVLNVIFNNFAMMANSNEFVEGFVEFTILTHKTTWTTVDGYRAILIMNELNKIINSLNKREPEGIGIGEIKLISGNHIKANEAFYGYQIVYALTDFK